MLFVTPFTCCAGSFSANFVAVLSVFTIMLKQKQALSDMLEWGFLESNACMKAVLYKLVTISFEFKQSMSPLSVLPSHCEHVSVTKDELL